MMPKSLKTVFRKVHFKVNLLNQKQLLMICIFSSLKMNSCIKKFLAVTMINKVKNITAIFTLMQFFIVFFFFNNSTFFYKNLFSFSLFPILMIFLLPKSISKRMVFVTVLQRRKIMRII